MSADNFNLVRETESGWWQVWTNLSASVEDENYPERPAERSFPSMEEAFFYAEEDGYTEYGTHVERYVPPRTDA